MSRRTVEPTPAYGPPPLRRVLEPELVPRLLAGPHASALPDLPPASAEAITQADLQGFLHEVLGVDEEAAVDFVRLLLGRGVTSEQVYLDLLAPTASVLGELWSGDRCDFVEVTVALGRLQRVLRAISRVFIAGGDASGTPTGRALLSCIPGEQHTLGLFMIAEFLIRDGWGVSVGPPILEADLLELLAEEWFDVVGFSVACDSHLSRLPREIRRVRAASRNPAIGVLVGGRVFNEQSELVARVGADASAFDARTVAATARRFVSHPLTLQNGGAPPRPTQE